MDRLGCAFYNWRCARPPAKNTFIICGYAQQRVSTRSPLDCSIIAVLQSIRVICVRYRLSIYEKIFPYFY